MAIIIIMIVGGQVCGGGWELLIYFICLAKYSLNLYKPANNIKKFQHSDVHGTAVLVLQILRKIFYLTIKICVVEK